MQIDYEKCLEFIERTNKIHLYPYQREMLRALCEGQIINCCRQSGRTTLARGVGDYVTHMLENQPIEDAAFSFPYTCLQEDGLLDPQFVLTQRLCLGKEVFEKEYLLRVEEETK